MKISGDDGKFVNSIKEQLERQAGGLDGATLSRLRQARAAALEAGRGRQRHWYRQWQPLAAVASVAVLVLTVWLALPPESGGGQQMAALDDMELLASQDDLEFYENIEFYAWMEGQDGQG